MIKPESDRTIKLEDLLQLKRAERPPAEFWKRFDEELRAKQLAALVQRRPWWQGVPAFLSRTARYHLPIGATAALALTLVSFKERAHTHSVEMSPRIGSVVEARQNQPIMNVVISTSEEDASPAPAAAVMESSHATGAASLAANELRSEATAPGELSRLVPMLDLPSVASTNSSVELPASRSIAQNLAEAEKTAPGVTNRYLASVGGFESRLAPVRKASVEPLAQMDTPADRRRNRLLGTALPSSGATPVLANDRITSRLSDDRLTEEAISRFGAKGDRLLVKF